MRRGALPVCRANDPPILQAVMRDDAFQASVAVLSMMPVMVNVR
jgi:hypothetical protein